MAKWKVTYRAKKSPYVVGLQKRRGIKMKESLTTVTFSGEDLNTRQNALRAFKKIYYWAIVTSLKKIR